MCKTQYVLSNINFIKTEVVEYVTFVCTYTCLQLKEKFVGPKEELQFSLDDNWKHELPQESRADFGDSILKEIGKLKCENEPQAKGI